MGGKNSVTQTGADFIKGSVETGMAGVTGGIYNPNTGSIKVGASQLDNVGKAVTGGYIMEQMTPKLPEAPVAEDPSIQAKRAQAEAEAKLASQVGERARGLSSTILGGSVSQDSAVLKKRKLLGE